MKKITLIFTCVSFLGNCYSQTLKIDNGISINSMSGKTQDLFAKKANTYSGLLGIDYLQKRWFYLSSQVGYLKLGGKENMQLVEQVPQEKQTWSFAHFNTSFRVRVEYSKAEFYLGTGPYVNLLLGTSAFDRALYEAYTAKRANWGVKTEAGINEHVNRFIIGVNCSYLVAFSPVAESQYNPMDAKSLSFYLSLGYKLKQYLEE